MNFNNNLPPFPPFPASNAPSESQLEAFMKFFSPSNPLPSEPSPEDRSKAQSPNVKALMTQMFLNNYRNYMMMAPQMNPLFYPPGGSGLMNMMGGGLPLDPMGLRRGNVMNDMMMQAFMAKFNMFNMMNPYQMGVPNPLLNSMMMDSFFRNFMKDGLSQSSEVGALPIVNLDAVGSLSDLCLCNGKKHPEDVPIMTCLNEGCGRKFHLPCLKYRTPEQDCPFCFLRKQDPLHPVLKVLLPPFVLPASPGVIFKKKLPFDLESLKSLFEREDVYLELRSVRLDEAYKHETSWPDYGSVALNESVVLEFQPLQSNSCLKRRKDEKISLKTFVRPEANELKFTIRNCTTEEENKSLRVDKTAEFLVGAYLIQKIGAPELVTQLVENNKQSEKDCLEFLRSYFTKEPTNHEGDLFLDQMKINLLDPIDFQSIKTPCRGRLCRHYNCFSLETFVGITRDSSPRKWRCPICKKPCYEFLIDGYLLKIIEEARLQNRKLKELILFDDGRLQVVENEAKPQDDENDDAEEKAFKDAMKPERFSVVIEEKGELNDGLSANTKSTEVKEEGMSQKVDGDAFKKRKYREIGKEEEKKEGGGGYHLRSKKVCLGKMRE